MKKIRALIGKAKKGRYEPSNSTKPDDYERTQDRLLRMLMMSSGKMGYNFSEPGQNNLSG